MVSLSSFAVVLLTMPMLGQQPPTTPPATTPPVVTPPAPVAPTAAPGTAPPTAVSIPTPAPPKSNPYITWDKPRRYDLTFNVGIHSLAVQDPTRPLLMPLIPQSTSSYVNLDTIEAEVQLHGQRLDGGSGPELLSVAGLFNERLIEGPTAGITFDPKIMNLATQLRFRTFHEAICYSSTVDDQALQQIPWPASWPSAVQDELQPQALIESDHAMFANAVVEVSGGDLRLVSPWVAAKELVRYACNNIQKQGDTTLYGPGRSIRGLEVYGALAAAERGTGTPNDLVCVCVALLRAAGIPARAVIGRGEDRRDKKNFLVWAELFLPEAGWIPFDPDEIRRKGVRHWNVLNDWPEFGTMSDLNRRVPLAYAFAPDNGRAAYDCYAIWGWSRLASSSFPVPINQWESRIGDQRLRMKSWNTPSVLHFSLNSHGRVNEH